jgi:hypothetical protein
MVLKTDKIKKSSWNQSNMVNRMVLILMLLMLAGINSLVVLPVRGSINPSQSQSFLFRLTGSEMANEGEHSVEDIYRQEEEREKEGDQSGPPSTEPELTLEQRMKRYLSLHKKSVAAGTGNDSSSTCNSDSNSNYGTGIPDNKANTTYTAINKLRCKNLDAQNLYGGVVNNSSSLGSFEPCGETWGAPPIEKQNFSSRQNISLNFDPVAMICKNCNEPHRLLAGGGAGYDDKPRDRMVFVLADQSFPAAVGPEGGGCMMVIRLEFGSPMELVDLFLDLTRGCQIPAGSVLLLSSLSHLADSGPAAYSADLNFAAIKLMRALRGGIIVLPGLVFPAAKISDPSVVRGLVDILTWSAEAALVSDSACPVLKQCYLDLRDLLVNSGTGAAQTNYGMRLRLPKQIGHLDFKKWDTCGPENLKDSTGPLPAKEVIRIINIATTELAVGLGLPYIKVANLYGSQPPVLDFGRDAVVIGASHASRLQEALKRVGSKARWLETRNWRPRTAAVDTLITEMEKAIEGLEKPVLIFLLLDNGYFQTGCEDGSIIPHSKDVTGHYHVDGDLVCGPVECAKKLFQQIVPALRKFSNLDKILLTPLPRYIWGSCCPDEDHAANTREPGYQEEQMKSLDACQRLWRNLAHREAIPNLKICNAGRQITDSLFWAADPVHPTPDAYDTVVGFICKGLADMATKRSLLLDQDSDADEATPRSKRQKEDGGLDAMPPPRSRPSWTSTTGHFVSPSGSRPFNRGRGGPFGRFNGRGGNRRPYFY